MSGRVRWIPRIFVVVLTVLVCSSYAQRTRDNANDPNDQLRVDGD